MGYFLPHDPPALKFATRVGNELEPILRESTVPIIGVKDTAFADHGPISILTEKPVTQMGTGTLFRVGKLSFIVTAAHVVHEIEKRKESLSIPYGNPASPMPYHGKCFTAGGIADLALLLLPDEIVEELTGRRYLQLSDVEFREDLGQGWYFLHGYPSVRSFTSTDWLTTTLVSFTHRTGLYNGKTSAFSNYYPDYHILLDCSGEARLADDGSPTTFPPSLGGISGSSIWLGFSEHQFMDDWTPGCAKVVAVETSVYPESRVVQGTRWVGVAMMLWRYYPKLRDEIFTHLPDSLRREFQRSGA